MHAYVWKSLQCQLRVQTHIVYKKIDIGSNLKKSNDY